MEVYVGVGASVIIGVMEFFELLVLVELLAVRSTGPSRNCHGYPLFPSPRLKYLIEMMEVKEANAHVVPSLDGAPAA